MEISYQESGGRREWLSGAGDDARMVDVLRTDPGLWQVSVSAAELVRVEPLETRMRDAVTEAILRVPGVIGTEEEDREVWSVDGEPDGEALTRSVADAIESLADEIEAHVAGLQ